MASRPPAPAALPKPPADSMVKAWKKEVLSATGPADRAALWRSVLGGHLGDWPLEKTFEAIQADAGRIGELRPDESLRIQRDMSELYICGKQANNADVGQLLRLQAVTRRDIDYIPGMNRTAALLLSVLPMKDALLAHVHLCLSLHHPLLPLRQPPVTETGETLIVWVNRIIDTLMTEFCPALLKDLTAALARSLDAFRDARARRILFMHFQSSFPDKCLQRVWDYCIVFGLSGCIAVYVAVQIESLKFPFQASAGT